ncbi:MAG: hypothetical protein A2Z21_02865 [Candidatus Fraserbacteria bacterium RBG_16_55_9]|uniref:Phosphodiesterase n=1 Tax=Fraserbacteria sp. (strain RBG_16_55_9) TaxID=1817864 RepID=A0A1F5UUX9_FRAXR|nr:MAG: hypothetical protein A2Z21_02865 [Candidatus Fraserbacteria bacterium RBG_16_55_9]
MIFKKAGATQIEAEIRSQRLAILDDQIQPGEFILPDFERYSLVNLANTVLERFGLPTNHPPLPKELLPAKHEVQKVVLLLIDALGYCQLVRFLDREPDSLFCRLTAHGRFMPLTSIFPSTTTASLATLHTGLTPQEHGILGYRLFLKEFGMIANMIRLSPLREPASDRLFTMGLKPKKFLGCATLHDRLRQVGVRSYVSLKQIYVRSGLSRLLSPKAATAMPFANSSDMSVLLRKILERPNERAFLFVYWDALDEIAHRYGPESEEWETELRSLAYTLEQACLGDLEAPFLKHTLFFIAADHGQLRVVPKHEVMRLTRLPKLKQSLLIPPTGEYRATYLYAKAGRLTELESGLREGFGDRLVVLRSREALEAGLFGRGSIHRETLDRIGDLIAIPRGTQALYWPHDSYSLIGRHGGLTDEEMLVPLIAF